MSDEMKARKIAHLKNEIMMLALALEESKRLGLRMTAQVQETRLKAKQSELASLEA